MPEHPNPDEFPTDVVQEVIRKALEIAPPKSAPIKMEALGILGNPPDSDLKFRIEVLAKLIRHFAVLPQNLVQIRLNPPVESNFHGGEAPQRVRRT